MPVSGAKLVRETGTAFALLAIYVLILLAPLHQAAGLQRDLASLGYETIGTWSVCATSPGQSDDKTQDNRQIKCPAAGIGKNELVAVLPPAPVFDTALRLLEKPFLAFDRVEHSTRLDPIGQPRAPPALV